jgi:penicillin-binding protein 2
MPGFQVAAKTGTAETGARKEFTNSLVIGFFPYEKPKYAFAVILERTKAGNTVGAPAVMSNILQWIALYRSEMTSPARDVDPG